MLVGYAGNKESMLEHWLKPSKVAVAAAGSVPKGRFGGQVEVFGDAMPDLTGTRVVLLGAGDAVADAVRQELYGLSFPFEGLRVADIGNIRRTESSFLLPVLRELLEGGICPVLLGQADEWVLAQFKAHLVQRSSVSLLVVQESIPYHPVRADESHYLQHILQSPSQELFHFCNIGCQSHYLDAETLSALAMRDFDCLRLGKARTNISEMEPYIRDADLLCFHLSAMKGTEAPGVAHPTPSGFFSEEACQLSRYAGMSDKLASVGFYGYRPGHDPDRRTAQLTAQLVWYFIDGFNNRKQDFPASLDDLIEYIVDLKGYDFQLFFWKSNKTGRWWLQVPIHTRAGLERHRLIPCSYNDYLHTLQGDLPARLLNAFKRFS
ncbi:MAG: hypothetical protein RLY31_2360 [Bacteroidota bacterium]|jgi:formiminoglutamase